MKIEETIKAIHAMARPTIAPAIADAENVIALKAAPVTMMKPAATAPIMPVMTAYSMLSKTDLSPSSSETYFVAIRIRM